MVLTLVWYHETLNWCMSEYMHAHIHTEEHTQYKYFIDNYLLLFYFMNLGFQSWHIGVCLINVLYLILLFNNNDEIHIILY